MSMSECKIPMKRQKIFTEQVNAKITPELKQKVRELKNMGVDVGELCRNAISQAIEDAHNSMRAS